jgi:hypothetical protein
LADDVLAKREAAGKDIAGKTARPQVKFQQAALASPTAQTPAVEVLC